MNRLYLIIIFFSLFYPSNLAAQDGIFWGHIITFEFDNIELNLDDNNDSLLSIEFFVNQELISTNCQSWEAKSTKNGQYHLEYSCSGIGGASQTRKIKCPDIYMKLEFKQSSKRDSAKYITRLIPFVFETATGAFQKIIVPKIDINHLLINDDVVVLIDAIGKYEIIKEKYLEIKPKIKNLVKFIKN